MNAKLYQFVYTLTFFIGWLAFFIMSPFEDHGLLELVLVVLWGLGMFWIHKLWSRYKSNGPTNRP